MISDYDQNITIKKSMPIGWRLTLHVALISSILTLLVMLSLIPFRYASVEQEAVTEAHILAEAVATIYRQLGDDQPHDHARRMLLRVARTPHISLVNVLGPKRTVKYSTDSRELGKYYQHTLRVIKEDGSIVVTYVEPNANSNVSSVIVIIDRIMLIEEVCKLFLQTIIGLFITIIILSVLVKGLVEKFVTSRLSRLMGLIENAEQGSFLIRAQVDRYDEIGHVIIGFNQLLGLITQIEARQLEKENRLKDDMVQKNIRQNLEEALFQLEKSNEKLQGKIQSQDLLMESAHRLSGTLERESVVERLIVLLKEKLSWPCFAVFLVEEKNPDKICLRLSAAYGFLESEVCLSAKVTLGDGIVGIVAQTGAPAIIMNLNDEKELKLWHYQDKSLQPPKTQNINSLMAVPMIHKGRVNGVFLFCHPSAGAFDNDDATLISALGAQSALAIVNAELYETTLDLATSDPLTGVLNRRAMVKQIKFELARSQRFHTNIALLLVDVDHFKAYNDRMGHVLGDVALKEIAKALKDNVRKVDTVARFGGEEFCVILPQADVEAAKEVAEKLCASVREIKLRGAEKQELGHLSISIGIAVVPGNESHLDDDDTVNEFISLADESLYRAKSLGRDRFVV